MEQSVAVELWKQLESERTSPKDITAEYPVYKVRLDAGMHRSEETRILRLRVEVVRPDAEELGDSLEHSEDDWRYVLDLARDQGLAVEVDNSALVLT